MWSCEKETAPTVEPPARATTEVRIELLGCAQQAGDECWLPPENPAMCERTSSSTTLELWADAPLEVRVDGRFGTLPKQQRGGGFHWSLPAGEYPLELRIHGQVVREIQVHAALLEDPRLARARSRGERSASELASLLEHLQPRARLAALDLLTDTLGKQAKASVSEGAQYLRAFDQRSEEAYALAMSLGDPDHAACHAQRALQFALTGDLDGERARDWAERLEAQQHVGLRTAGQNQYYLGLFARWLGDLQGALDAFSEAEQLFATLGLSSSPFATSARNQRSTILALVGRPEQALTLLATAGDTFERCTDWLKYRSNSVWVLLLLEDMGIEIEDPTPELEDIERLMLDLPECFDEALYHHVTLNRGVAHARRVRGDQAMAAFERGDALGIGSTAEFVWLERTRVALQAGLPAPAPPSVAASPLPADRWRRAYWEGRMAQSVGRTDDAIASYRVAEELLTTLARSLRLDGGREGLLMHRQPSSAHLVSLLLERGEVEDALCIARVARSRADQLLARTEHVAALSTDGLTKWSAAELETQRLERALASLEDEYWRLPLDERTLASPKLDETRRNLDKAKRRSLELLYGENATATAPAPSCKTLPPPEVGELTLLLFPLAASEGRWSVFAFGVAGARAAHIDLNPNAPDGLVRLLDGEFAPQVAAARSIRILPTADAWSIAFAELPWHGRPLLEHTPITLALDLSTPRSPTPVDRTALVVGDPNDDLEHARAEANAIAMALGVVGWKTTKLVGRDATADRLRTAVANTSLLHFAGHAGAHGWESRVRLNRGERLDVRDFLSLPAAPHVAILPACEIASASERALGGGMSIARSLLLSGTAVVVGGTGALDDAIAQRVSETFYSSGIPTSARVAARNLRHALLTVSEETSDRTVLRSFVAMVP